MCSSPILFYFGFFVDVFPAWYSLSLASFVCVCWGPGEGICQKASVLESHQDSHFHFGYFHRVGYLMLSIKYYNVFILGRKVFVKVVN